MTAARSERAACDALWLGNVDGHHDAHQDGTLTIRGTADALEVIRREPLLTPT